MGEATPMTILQAETRVLVGGSDGQIHQYKNNGLSISTVATSSNMVYSLTVSFQLLFEHLSTFFRNRLRVNSTAGETRPQSMYTRATDIELIKFKHRKFQRLLLFLKKSASLPKSNIFLIVEWCTVSISETQMSRLL